MTAAGKRTGRMVTLREVADAAGVSVRTVSNVVNDFPRVAPDTRERVQQSIDRLGYRPNQAARALRTGRSGVISLAVPEIDSPYFGELAGLLVRAAAERALHIRIEQTDGLRTRELALLDPQIRQQADGLLISPWGVSADELAALAQSGPPVLTLGELVGLGTSVDHVAIDNVAAASDLVRHLLDRGRSRLAVIGVQDEAHNHTAQLRLQGVHDTLAAAGLRVQPGAEFVVPRLHRQHGADAADQLVAQGHDVDALVCFSDQLALGAMSRLAAHGISVPTDVAVVGFDDIEDGRYSVPSLTTVAPDKSTIVNLALDLLLERIAGGGPSTSRHPVVPHEIRVRESTAGRPAE